MKIKKIEISNWRSIKRLNIKAEDLMVIIGKNNHGKSNIISAILFFFGEIKFQDLDFNKGAEEIFVEITFCNLNDSDNSSFKKYVTASNEIRVRKVAYLQGSFEYHGYLENPTDDFLKESNASSYTKRELASSLPFFQYLPTSGRLTKQDIINAQVKYIENNSGVSFNYELEVTNFLGLKSVAKGIFGEVFFLPAVKDASDDYSSKEASAFGRLYSRVIKDMSETDEKWKNTKKNLSDLFESLNEIDKYGNQNLNRPHQLVKFEEELSNEVKNWDAKIGIEISTPDIENVFKANTNVWVDDGVRTDIKRKGHGLQRALILALINVLSNRSKNEEESAETGRKASKSMYFLFEEPELYLHPQAQKSLFQSLTNLADSGNQVIICTHSSSLINVKRYKSIIIALKENEETGTVIKQCQEELFLGNVKKDFNLSYWINPDRGELFFATKVILLEGPTDKTIIPLLARKLKVHKFEYTLIDCGSKDNIPLYISLLNKFKIPYTAVYDKDHQQHKLPDAIESAEKSSEKIENVIDKNIGNSFIFENDIEEEIGMETSNKNKPFIALTHVSGGDFNFKESFKEKIRKIYA